MHQIYPITSYTSKSARAMFALLRSPGILPAQVVGTSTPGRSWNKVTADSTHFMRFGMPGISLPEPTFGTRWPTLDVHGRQLRAFRTSQPLSLRPTPSATAACRSQVLQSRRVQSQSDINSEPSNKPTVRRLIALLWPDRVLLGVALCFLVGAAVSQAQQTPE